jgi:Na+/proline symporter
MSALYLTAMLGHIAYQRSRGDLEVLSRRTDLRPLLVALPIVSGLTSAANLVGLGGEHAFALYIASLILGLCFAGLLFLAVARRMVGDEPS